jgi:DNA-binding LytR/AlgR family response regulator
MNKAGRILIVEDEVIIAENTRRMSLDMGLSDEVHTAINPNEAMRMAESAPPDIVLLDIRLGDHADGVDLGAWLHARSIPFIFLTAHGDPDTIQRAVKVSPAGDMIKPVTRQDLMANLSLFFSRSASEPVFVFRDGTHDVRVAEKDIMYLRSDNIYTELHTTERRYVVRQSMKNMLDQMSTEFLQIHRSYVVNPAYVRETNALIYLSNGVELPLSRTYRPQVQERLYGKKRTENHDKNA